MNPSRTRRKMTTINKITDRFAIPQTPQPQPVVETTTLDDQADAGGDDAYEGGLIYLADDWPRVAFVSALRPWCSHCGSHLARETITGGETAVTCYCCKRPMPEDVRDEQEG